MCASSSSAPGTPTCRVFVLILILQHIVGGKHSNGSFKGERQGTLQSKTRHKILSSTRLEAHMESGAIANLFTPLFNLTFFLPHAAFIHAILPPPAPPSVPCCRRSCKDDEPSVGLCSALSEQLFAAYRFAEARSLSGYSSSAHLSYIPRYLPLPMATNNTTTHRPSCLERFRIARERLAVDAICQKLARSTYPQLNRDLCVRHGGSHATTTCTWACTKAPPVRLLSWRACTPPTRGPKVEEYN